MLKAIPDSFTDFATLIDEDYVFIDKTRFLQVYEESKVRISLFLRPRRFGKTMFTELLRYYYDRALKSESDRLFKECYIASHPTPEKSSFYVLRFDFSGISTSGSTEAILDGFRRNIIVGIKNFLSRYPEFMPTDVVQSVTEDNQKTLMDALSRYYRNLELFRDPSSLIGEFLHSLIPQSFKVMVIIDEYDNFTNDVLSRDPRAFGELARKGGALSSFYQYRSSVQ